MVALGALIAAPALVGCENASRLDKAPASAERGAAAAPMPIKADHSGSVEDRLTRLENNLARYGDTLEWVNGIHEQQKQQAKAQAEQQRREEPDPDAVFAVDIAPDLKLGQIEGPAGAPVTIVEAWDFA
ncbi:MAG: hypothetical protein E6J91_08240 [Deltaproteobacteria bacterium]|nr:MAG: hypothetical protein E6J91_08240 [Deltaproteobacteria bacterium]